MISDLLSGNINIINTLLSIPIILIALTFHEYAHGYAALKMGDPTARNLGRLTLNPLKHLDIMGTLCMFLCGFGWAKPVPINTRNFEKARKGMAITALAGPLMNILLSFIGLILYVVSFKIYLNLPTSETVGLAQMHFTDRFMYALILFCSMFHTMNLYLAVFNLIPLPPLDGSRIFFIFLPDKLYFSIMKYEHIIQIILMVALFTGLLSTPLGFVAGKISDLMFKLIGFIPGLSII